ncbi:hypothetical protein ACQKL5_13945 [Peribacillus sp. NPDC097675]|uniref:hypothetical protein n=1 Tax=Peribacillus sp. NPDC097675 TaxID=3390618 RepID=UPI003D0440E6
MWINSFRPVNRCLGIQISFSISNLLWKILVLFHLDVLVVLAALGALSEDVEDVDVAEDVDAAVVAVVNRFKKKNRSLQSSCRAFLMEIDIRDKLSYIGLEG